MFTKRFFIISASLLAGTAAAATIVFLQRRKTRPMPSAPIKPLPNQAIYHFYAPIYDWLFSATYASARKRTAQLLELQPGERLLISGVGTGLDLPYLPAGTQVTGIDISIDMLRLASQKTSPAQVTLIQMDAQCLDLPINLFDAALLNLIVSVAPDGRAVFQEAWRTLKPGGRLVLFDKFAPEGQGLSPLRKAAGFLFRQLGTDVNRQLSEVLGDVENGMIELNEPSLFFGQYRILRLRKPFAEELNQQ
jgi:phosphatidylethanolamine/phosphatidyl-N-methylethanolamine N-methyltransferase